MQLQGASIIIISPSSSLFDVLRSRLLPLLYVRWEKSTVARAIAADEHAASSEGGRGLFVIAISGRDRGGRGSTMVMVAAMDPACKR